MDESVVSAPARAAVRQHGRDIDYARLGAASRAYAKRLADEGVSKGGIVAISAPRSVSLVVAQLAVLRCGAAYTSLDPRWPEARRARILDAVRAQVLIGELDASSGRGLALPDLHAATTAPVDAPCASVAVDPSDPAMVVYTSGSSGTPKGVVVPHRAVTRMFRDELPPGFGPRRRTGQAAPPWWDMYSYELWGPLMTGGTSVLVAGSAVSPGEVRRMIQADGVTSLRLTTSLFRLFVEEDLGCFTGLSSLIVGGEPMPAAHAAAFLHAHPSTHLYNGYGPTEGAMHATRHRVRPSDCTVEGDIPLGTAVPATEVMVLDEDLRPCAVGQVGEICIGGDGLALGYWDDESSTARAFVTVGEGPARRKAYRTGDLGIVDSCGLLRFRGRRDRQLKVAGNRVEPAEIERVLGAHPGVAECVVVPLRESDGSVIGLTAVYRAADDPPAVGMLRAHARAFLPRFAHPGTYVEMRTLPRTDTGKLDAQKIERLVNVTEREGALS